MPKSSNPDQSPSRIVSRRLEEKQRAQRQASAAKLDGAAPGLGPRGTSGSSFATQERRPWFARKTYGWGWTPATWQGWTVVAVHIMLIVVWARLFLKDRTDEPRAFAIFFSLLILQTALLIYISYRKGEPARWQWGGK